MGEISNFYIFPTESIPKSLPYDTRHIHNVNVVNGILRSAVSKKTNVCLTLIVPSANSVSPLKIAVANRLIHAIQKNCIVYLFL